MYIFGYSLETLNNLRYANMAYFSFICPRAYHKFSVVKSPDNI